MGRDAEIARCKEETMERRSVQEDAARLSMFWKGGGESSQAIKVLITANG
jgi:hypothetical protein